MRWLQRSIAQRSLRTKRASNGSKRWPIGSVAASTSTARSTTLAPRPPRDAGRSACLLRLLARLTPSPRGCGGPGRGRTAANSGNRPSSSHGMGRRKRDSESAAESRTGRSAPAGPVTHRKTARVVQLVGVPSTWPNLSSKDAEPARVAEPSHRGGVGAAPAIDARWFATFAGQSPHCQGLQWTLVPISS
jgi:hypothetical protein